MRTYVQRGSPDWARGTTGAGIQTAAGDETRVGSAPGSDNSGDDGVVMLVEPQAGDTVTENLNPVGRLFYAASSLICTPASQSQEVGRALGAQAGAARLTEVANEAGFTRVRTAASTPFNIVLELRP